MTPAQFWQIEMQRQQNEQENMQQMTQQVFSSAAQLAGMYAENKQLEAKASGYDDIGKILNTAMFSNNPDAAAAFGNLQKEKDPRKKVMGYEQLFSLVGPMSNMMMAQGRMGMQQQGQQIQQNAPYVAADIKNRQNIAGGNVPHGGGMAPVEPPLPPYSPAPVSQPPAPSASPASSIPGGDESMRRYNEWKSKRGY